MKKFKKIDCIVQVILLLVALCWNLVGLSRGSFLGNEPFIIPYFTIGGWQLVSALVHAIKPMYNKKMPRRIYLFVLLAVIAGAILAYFQGDAVLMFFYALLFLAPGMAIYYCVLCIAETRAIKNTALTVRA